MSLVDHAIDTLPKPQKELLHRSCREICPDLFSLATIAFDEADGELVYKILNNRDEFLRLAKRFNVSSVSSEVINFEVLRDNMLKIDAVLGTKEQLLELFQTKFAILYEALFHHEIPTGIYLYPNIDSCLLFLWPGKQLLSPDNSPLVTLTRALFELSPRTCVLLEGTSPEVLPRSAPSKSKMRSRKITPQVSDKTSDEVALLEGSESIHLPTTSSVSSVRLYGSRDRLNCLTSKVHGAERIDIRLCLSHKLPYQLDRYRIDFSRLQDHQLEIIASRFKCYGSSKLYPCFRTYHEAVDAAELAQRHQERELQSSKEKICENLVAKLVDEMSFLISTPTTDYDSPDECPVCLENINTFRFNCCRQGICEQCKTIFEASQVKNCPMCRHRFDGDPPFERGPSRHVENRTRVLNNRHHMQQNQLHSLINPQDSRDDLSVLKSQILREALHSGRRYRRASALHRAQQELPHLKNITDFNLSSFKHFTGTIGNKVTSGVNYVGRFIFGGEVMDGREAKYKTLLMKVLEFENNEPLIYQDILFKCIQACVQRHVMQNDYTFSLDTSNLEHATKTALKTLRNSLASQLQSEKELPIAFLVDVGYNDYNTNPIIILNVPNVQKCTLHEMFQVNTQFLIKFDDSTVSSFTTPVNVRSHRVVDEKFEIVNIFNIKDCDLLILSDGTTTEVLQYRKFSQKAQTQTFPRRTYCAALCYQSNRLILYSNQDQRHSIGVFQVDIDHGKPVQLKTFDVGSRFATSEQIDGSPLFLKIALLPGGESVVCLDRHGALLYLNVKKESFEHRTSKLPPQVSHSSVYMTVLEQPLLLFLCYKVTETWIAEGFLLDVDAGHNRPLFHSIGKVKLTESFVSPSFHLLRTEGQYLLMVHDESTMYKIIFKLSTRSSFLELVCHDQNDESFIGHSVNISPVLRILPRALRKFGMTNVSIDLDPFFDELPFHREIILIDPIHHESSERSFAELMLPVTMDGFLSPVSITSEKYYHLPMLIPEVSAATFLIRAINCVPVQIARFDYGTFLPLYDGHNGQNWYENYADENGITVQTIAQNIRFGAMDLLFSYFSKKQVSVITAAGEQSSGKSTFLNHLMGSFFDVSGARTTIGVWMGCRVSETRLWISLDLEGLSSYERSMQQDAYQSLFGAALAQAFVLRTSMHFGRFIEQLLSAWVSAATTLQYSAEDNLFRSALFMTPRDVESDASSSVIDEFTRHLEHVVKNSASSSQNREHVHALSLFNGTSIAPFPPYAKFNDYLDHLKLFFAEVLELDPRFASTSEFRSTAALLLAKLFVQDFTSVSESAVNSKLDLVHSFMVDAIAGGAIGPLESSSNSIDMWKTSSRSLEDQQQTVIEDPVIVFKVEASHGLSERIGSSCIVEISDELLCISVQNYCDSGLLLGSPRCFTQSEDNEPQFFQNLAQYFTSNIIKQVEGKDVALFAEFLNAIVTRRCKRVIDWFDSIVDQDRDKAVFKRMRRDLYSKFDSLRQQYRICKGNCTGTNASSGSVCFMPCSLLNGHSGACLCLGNHECARNCSYCPDERCYLGANHVGDCICRVREHKCSGTCSLSTFRGCQMSCSQELSHSGGCCCAVPLSEHFCSHVCSLEKCNYPCKIPHNIEHAQHDCKNPGCPEKCPLCNRLCASRDHFHSNCTDQHLCGQQHSCDKECSKDGNCEILTHLRQTEQVYKTSTGDEIQYQLFSEQNARRKKCGTNIEPESLVHDGGCDCTAEFHYCNRRCSNCGYFCSLPIRHEGLCSCTHGNMRNSKLVSLSERVTFGQVGTFGRNDSGIIFTCTNMCRQYGRGHIHLLLENDPRLADVPSPFKRPQTGTYEEGKVYVEITCSAYWEFVLRFDPQFQFEEAELFARCASICGGEHENPSFCTLELFHPPHQGRLPPSLSNGYVCDGHVFPCVHSNGGTYHTFLVVDRSGSMGSTSALPTQSWINQKNILGSALEACFTFTQKRLNQNPTDLLTLITFDTSAETLLVNHPVTDTNTLRNAIAQVSTGGGTHFQVALETAMEAWRNNVSETHRPIFILFSDGKDNSRNLEVLRNLIIQFLSEFPSAIVHTIGFGRGVDRVYLEDLAINGHGEYHHTEDSLSLCEAFVGIAKNPVNSSFVQN
ncbi:hypothetical protein RCL1_004469 [Eukaryota sp. TZLM3-RCL]